MNIDQVMSIARALLQIIGTSLVAYSATTGMTAEMWATISGGILMIVPIAWGIIAHTDASMVASAAKIPEVANVAVVPTQAGLALKQAAGSTPDAQVVVGK